MQMMDAHDTPRSFDFWSAIFTLACVVGRRAYVAKPRDPIWLEQRIILGGTGTTRTDVVVSICRELVSAALPTNISLFAARFTAKELGDALEETYIAAGQASAVICVDNITAIAKRRTSKTFELLTGRSHSEYDGARSRLAGDGTKAVHINLLAGANREWQRAVPENFAAACTIIEANKPKRKIAYQAKVAIDRKAVAHALDHIASAVRNLAIDYAAAIPITLTQGAQRDYTTTCTNNNLDASMQRKLLQVAALLCIDEELFVIGSRHVGKAVDLVGSMQASIGRTEKQLGRSTHKGKQRSPTGHAFTRIVDGIRMAGREGMARDQISRTVERMRLGSVAVDQLLAALLQAHLVQCFIAPKAEGRAPTIWRATFLINNHALVAQVRDKYLAQLSTTQEKKHG